MRLSALQSYTLPVEVACGEEPLILNFYPARFSRKLQQKLDAEKRALEEAEAKGDKPTEEQSEGAAAILVEVFASWNLTDEKGKEFPCTVRFLADEVGYFIIRRLLEGIYEAMGPGKPSAG